MKSVLVSLALVLGGVAACHHASDTAPYLEDLGALENFAVGQVYEAHPTRALVDKVEVLPSDTEPAIVRIEMTGAPTVRKIYRVHVWALDDGTFRLDRIEVVQ